MKLLNTETPVTRNFLPQILLNVQDFYFRKVGYTSYNEVIFRTLDTEFIRAVTHFPLLRRHVVVVGFWVKSGTLSHVITAVVVF
jgi:hypothetical protein